jgi:integrase
MKATTVFMARMTKTKTSEKGKEYFPLVPVEIKRDRPVKNDLYSSYYARYSGIRKDGTRGRIVEPLGDDIDTAYVQFLNIDTAQKQIRAGHTPSFTGSVLSEKNSIDDAIEQYLEDCKSVGNDTDTLGSKRRTLESFRAVAAQGGVITMEALKDPKVGRKVLLDYMRWMTANLATYQVDGNRPENTRHTRMRRLGGFLKQFGIKIKKAYAAGPDDTGLLRHEEFPKYKGRKATKYSRTTIQSLLKEANEDEADLIQFFLFTGFRDAEVGHIEWSDVNMVDHSINVHAKPKTTTRPWTWKPKDDESREEDIPLSKEFIDRMKNRKKRYAEQNCPLIFPSGVCKPDNNLLRRVRDVAKRAGVSQAITLHKFRRTFGSYIAKAYGIEMARKCLGHSDIATTQGYLTADGDDSKEVRETISAVQSEYVNL